jgi:hypothetical protein
MEISLFNNSLKVYPNGKVEILGSHHPRTRKCYRGVWHEKKEIISRTGYKVLHLWHEKKQKIYKIHRLVAHVYLGMDLEYNGLDVDHIDRNPLNNDVSNLRVITHQKNGFNTDAKGYHWATREKKWRAKIMLNGKDIHIGYFDNEEEARQAYLRAKEVYHII